MPYPGHIIRQNTSTAEARCIGMAAMLAGVPAVVVSFEDLADHAAALVDGAMPVGSVEFVREAMRLAGVVEPPGFSYPSSLSNFFERAICESVVKDVVQRCFVKPVQTKLFTGFVFDPTIAPVDLSEHDRFELEKLRSLPQDTPVWVSDAVNFAAEWRYYVLDGLVIGMARYDPDGLDDVMDPGSEWVHCVIDAFRGSSSIAGVTDARAFALDVGRFDDGRLAVVEVNDAWALGLYGRALEPRQYLEFLWARWSQLLEARISHG